MAVEIEAKFPLADPAPLRDRLHALAGQPFAQVLERNAFFDSPDDRLRESGCGLRVRVEHDLTRRGETRAMITFKGPRQPGVFKQREEIQTAVADGAAAARILAALGLAEKLGFEKRRASWRLDDCRVELDELPLLGHFLEIEGPGEDAIHAVAAKLGLQDAATQPASYPELLDRLLKAKNSFVRDITFEQPIP